MSYYKFGLITALFIFTGITGMQAQNKSYHKIHHREVHTDVTPGLTAFAFDNVNSTNENLIKFSLVAPGTQTIVSGVSSKKFYGADFNTFNQLFGIDGSATGTSPLYRIDTATGALTFIGSSVIPAGQRMTALTFDSLSSKWYAVGIDGSASTLYIVNNVSGGLVFVGSITGSPSVVGISAAKNGTLFGIDNVNNNLIKINKLTAQRTVVGSLGITLTSYQGMDFNPITGILFLASNSPSPQLRTVDTTSGAAALIGNITGTVSVTGFSIPFSGINVPPPASLCQGFITSDFPPTGWNLSAGSMYWVWSMVSARCLGTGSAEFDFYDAPSGDIEDLISGTFNPVNGTSDSLVMQEAYATYQGEDDQLQIRTSTDGGTTWTNLILLHGGTNGQLVTAPPTTNTFEPTCTQWQRLAFRLPAGTTRMEFSAISAFGNNMYLDSICIAGSPTGIEPINNHIASSYKLNQNYPNPFNPETKISFDIPKAGNVKLTIYNVLGEEVQILADKFMTAGTNELTWNAASFPSGVYFYKLQAGAYNEIKKMVLVK